VPEAAEWHHASVDPLAGETSVGKEEEQAPVSVEENKALVRRFFEAQAKGDLDAVREMMAPDFVDHSLLPGQLLGAKVTCSRSPRIVSPSPTCTISSRNNWSTATR
jgi:hypothetical protein